MKKLLYIVTNIGNSGGVAKLLSVKLNYLVQEFGYDISLVNTKGDSASTFYHFDDNIKIYSLNQDNSKLINILTYKKRLKNKIEYINPDIIINCDNGVKGALLPFLIKNKTPIIYENHSSKNENAENFIDNLKLRLKKLFFFMSLKRYEWIIVYQYARFERGSKNIKAISNPLSFKLPKEAIATNAKIVIAIGRFSFQKGYDRLLRIWEIVVKKHPDWMLNIYGEGSYSDLNNIIKELNISENIQFFKPVTNIKSIYLNASMLLNTSRYEPFGIANIEAMACGLPVFAFDNTLGPSSYIVNNENGFLIKKNDLESYAQKVIHLIENKSEMSRISKNAQKSVKKFNLEVIMNQWHDLFQSIH